MFTVTYKCPKCGHFAELPSLDEIYKSQEPCPVECKKCGKKFRKEELLRFAKHKAEQLVKDESPRV